MACVVRAGPRRRAGAVVFGPHVSYLAPGVARSRDIFHVLRLGLKRGILERRRVGRRALALAGRGRRNLAGGVHRLGLHVACVVRTNPRRRHSAVVHRPLVGRRTPDMAGGVDILHVLRLGREGFVCERRRVGRRALALASCRLLDLADGIHRLNLHVARVVLAHASRRHRAVVRCPFVGRLAPIVARRRKLHISRVVAARAGIVGLPADLRARGRLALVVNQIVAQSFHLAGLDVRRVVGTDALLLALLGAGRSLRHRPVSPIVAKGRDRIGLGLGRERSVGEGRCPGLAAV